MLMMQPGFSDMKLTPMKKAYADMAILSCL